MEMRDDRLPLPSEDQGNLTEEPRAGMTDDPLVAAEEGVPYDPPTDRVLSEGRGADGAPDAAGTDPTDAGELERNDTIQRPTARSPATTSSRPMSWRPSEPPTSWPATASAWRPRAHVSS